MTNKEDGDASRDCNPRMAALLAVHLVSQVLDEAYVVANAARDSGQPWRYLSMLNIFKTSRQGDTDDEPSFEPSKGDCHLNENKMEIVANVVATSTPQKITARIGSSDWLRILLRKQPESTRAQTQTQITDEDEESTNHNDNTFIGQGDEDLEMKNELAKSTSLFINHLFDMSDVERICDDTEVLQSSSEHNDLLAAAMNKIMESYIATSTIPLENFPLVPNVKIIDGSVPAELSRSDNSEYSFMADAFVADISRDVAFYIDDDIQYEKHDDLELYQPTVVEEFKEQVDENSQELIQQNVALYDNAYATLNRDYDQGSEEDGFPVLQDPKGMTLQEVELMTADTSDEDLSYHKYPSKQKSKEAVPTVSGVSGSRKSSLARKCRIQGARLLACLRGWWRRKTPGKRKESRGQAVLGMCPLSPDARRRASSLLDNRLLRSPSPSRPLVWKFNTVNEAMVNSNRWKDYTFDAKPEECGEF